MDVPSIEAPVKRIKTKQKTHSSVHIVPRKPLILTLRELGDVIIVNWTRVGNGLRNSPTAKTHWKVVKLCLVKCS